MRSKKKKKILKTNVLGIMCRLSTFKLACYFLQIKTLYLTFYVLGNFSCLSSADFYQNLLFENFLWIQIMTEVLERSQVMGQYCLHLGSKACQLLLYCIYLSKLCSRKLAINQLRSNSSHIKFVSFMLTRNILSRPHGTQTRILSAI